MAVESFPIENLREISHVLIENLTHKTLSEFLEQCLIPENGGNPKWERLLNAFIAKQEKDKCANNIINFIQKIMSPIRFINNQNGFEESRINLNKVLSFSGFMLLENGQISTTTKVSTLTEAEQKSNKLRKLLIDRAIHHDVLLFCKPELLQENYFHAVFEATKSVADKIRDKAGLTEDGAELVDKAFALNNPILAINRLVSESEKSEHKGFANLIKGIFGTFRNVTAHSPKIKWKIEEQDALDLLTMVSFLHRRLDNAIKIR